MLCRRRRGPGAVVYWSKAGEWHLVPADARGPRLRRGRRPGQGRSGSTCVGPEPGGGFVVEGGLVGKRAGSRSAAVVNCCHGGAGRGRHLQAALDLAGSATPRPGGRGGARDGQAGVRRCDGGRRPPDLPAHAARRRARRRRSPGPTSSSRGSAARRSASRSPTTSATARALRHARRRTCATVRWSSRTWPDSFDLNVSVRTVPERWLSPPSRSRCAVGRRPHLHLRREVPPSRGATGHLASSPPTSHRAARPPSELAARVVELTRRDRHPADRLPLRRLRGVRQRVNSIPGALALYRWPDTPPADILVAALEEAQRARPRAIQATTRWASPSAPPTASPASSPPFPSMPR